MEIGPEIYTFLLHFQKRKWMMNNALKQCHLQSETDYVRTLNEPCHEIMVLFALHKLFNCACVAIQWV